VRTIDIATCCLAGLLAAGCDSDPDPQLPDGGGVVEDGMPPPPPPPERGVASCAEVKAGNPTATNGAHRIFLAGNLDEPVDVYCEDMDTGEPKEYLDVPRNVENDPQGPRANVSVLYINNSQAVAEHPILYTYFTRVRLDLSTVSIDIGDTRHAISTRPAGSPPVATMALLGGQITHVAYGVSLFCRDMPGTPHNDTVLLDARVDLTGTPFELISEGPAFSQSAKHATIDDADPKAATLTADHLAADEGCNFVAPASHRWPPVNPTPGQTGSLRLRYVGL
jgi:hypothetical protein